MKILLATGNDHKVEEIKEILSEFKNAFLSLRDFPGLPKPVEDGKTYRENSLKKAFHYYNLTGLPTLADDSGLEIDAFNGEPGIFSARFISPEISFAERNKIVLERLKDVPDDERTARFKCCSVLVNSGGEHFIERGTLEGKIGHELKGEHGFGYDPIFVITDDCEFNGKYNGLHLAEAPPEVKNVISHRARAMKKIASHILNIIGNT